MRLRHPIIPQPRLGHPIISQPIIPSHVAAAPLRPQPRQRILHPRHAGAGGRPPGNELMLYDPAILGVGPAILGYYPTPSISPGPTPANTPDDSSDD